MGFSQGMISSNRSNRSMQKSATKFTRTVGQKTLPSGKSITPTDRAATERLKRLNAVYTMIVWLLTLAVCAIVAYLCMQWIN